MTTTKNLETPAVDDGTGLAEALVEPRSAEDVPELGDEVVGRRDALTEVFANADGTETVKVHSVPVHYRSNASKASCRST